MDCQFVIVFCGVFGDSIVFGFSVAYNSILERVISYKRAQGFLDASVFGCREFVMEACKWKGVNF